MWKMTYTNRIDWFLQTISWIDWNLKNPKNGIITRSCILFCYRFSYVSKQKRWSYSLLTLFDASISIVLRKSDQMLNINRSVINNLIHVTYIHQFKMLHQIGITKSNHQDKSRSCRGSNSVNNGSKDQV